MQPSFRAYSGDGPYIFVSYSHDDADKVFSELNWLHEQGYNIWYDDGINPGESWRNEIASAISDCSLFLIFITPNSAASEHCIREVNFAQNRSRRMLAVHLEETQLPDELEFNLSDRQALMKHTLAEEEYRRRFLERLGLVVSGTQERASSPVATASSADKNRTPLFAGLATVLIAGLVGFFLLSEDPGQPVAETESTTAPEVDQVPALPPNSIAVLPFENLSPSEENAYFAAGVHEDVVLSLAKIPAMTVIARKSVEQYANSTLSVEDIARELNVANIMQGSVRRAGDKVRVSVSLIDAATHNTLWGETYDRTLTDIFAIQSEIAGEITSQLQVSLDVGVREEIARAPTENFSAYERYLEARTRVNRAERVALLEEAIALDPNYVEAHAELSLSLLGAFSMSGRQEMDFDKAQIHAEKAHALAPENANALRARAKLAALQRDVETAEMLYEKALQIAPGNAALVWDYANHLMWRGEGLRGMEEFRKTLVLDPNSIQANLSVADLLIRERRTAEILPYLEKALALAGNDREAWQHVAGAYWRGGYMPESLAIRQRLVEEDQHSPVEYHLIGSALATLGAIDDALRYEGKLRKIDPRIADVTAAVIHNISGDNDLEYDISKRALAAYPDQRDYKVRMAYAAAGQSGQLVSEERFEEARVKRTESLRLFDEILEPDRREDGEIDIRLDNSLVFVARFVVMALDGQQVRSREAATRYLAWNNQESDYTTVSGHFERALAQFVLGERDAGLASLQKVRADSPGFYFFTWFEDTWGFEQYPEIYGDMKNNLVYQDLKRWARERQAAILEETRQKVPELFTDTSSRL